MKQSNEPNLALEIHRGATGAVEHMVRTYQDGLIGYALALLRDPFDAQEVAQDAFVRAHRALTASYDAGRCGKLALRPWLYRIARNLALNRRRARRARPDLPLESEELSRAADARQAADPIRTERVALDLAALAQAFARLDVSSRELVELRFVEGLSYSEIAAILRVTEASARGRLFRAVRRLRETMA